VTAYGYDPARVEALHQRTREAIAALDGLRSDDPAAADAIRAVARTRDTLERGWIPFIDAIRTSTAMTAWYQALGADPLHHAFASGASGPAPLSTWIATNGLDDLTDAEVIDQLDDAIDTFRKTVTAGLSIEQAERNLEAIADEAVRRARHDRAGFADVLDARLGVQAPIAILGAIDAFAESVGRDPRRHGFAPAALDLAELLGPLSASEPVAELIGWHLLNQRSLAPLIAARPRAWDPNVLAELTTELIRATHDQEYLPYNGPGSGAIWPSERAHNISVLAEVLAKSPAAALAVLGDDLALEFLATDNTSTMRASSGCSPPG
jgi:hypothetical protein